MGHAGCKRGNLAENMVLCSMVCGSLASSYMTYITYELRDVETFGKGKPFKRMEKVETQIGYESFVSKFRFVI